MNKLPHYLQQIKVAYPDLSTNGVRLNQDGQYNDVLIINDELVFRFAKVPDAIETLQQEVMILCHIQMYITLPIPNPLYVNVSTSNVGEAFIGYRMIAGEPLWFDTFHAITDVTVLKRLAAQLSGFLQELHQIPIATALPAGIPECDTQAEWADLYAQIQAKLFSYMRPVACQQVTEHFENFLNNTQLSGFQAALRHGDFGPGNILHDLDAQSIAGIIDFGGAGLGDPAVDFAALFTYGEDFYRTCCEYYPEMETALDRVNFYRGTFALQEALFGIENDDKEAFQSGIRNYL